MRKAIALVANMGELPVVKDRGVSVIESGEFPVILSTVFVATDQFVLLGLVKQEAVDGIPVLLC